jgi:ribosomal protein L12E/L44/L45/RPP1/RPP2
MTDKRKEWWVKTKESRLRVLAEKALEESNLDEIMEIAGAAGNGTEASAALKAILAERVAEYTVRAMKEAKKRDIDFGAAAVVIGCKD